MRQRMQTLQRRAARDVQKAIQRAATKMAGVIAFVVLAAMLAAVAPTADARTRRPPTTTTTTRPATTTTKSSTTTSTSSTTSTSTTTTSTTTTSTTTTSTTTTTTNPGDSTTTSSTDSTTTTTGVLSTGPPPAGGYFATLAAAAPLPTEAECAARVHRSTWEPRPQNYDANHLVRPQPVTMPYDENFNALYQTKYLTRMDGNFTGTTDEIIQWAACKWGIADDLVRAQAVQESNWRQAAAGDNEPRKNGHCPSDISTDPCPTSFGLLQSKWYYRPGTYPWTRTSTAFSLDSSLAEMRGCLDGMSYAGTKTTGDVWGCIGFWYSGTFGKGDSAYIADIKAKLSQKVWLTWAG